MASCGNTHHKCAKGQNWFWYSLGLTFVVFSIYLMVESLSFSKFADSTVPCPWDFWKEYDTRQLNIIYIENAHEIEYESNYWWDIDVDLPFSPLITRSPSQSPSQSPSHPPSYDERTMYEQKLREYVPLMNDILDFHELRYKLEAGDLYKKPQSAYSRSDCDTAAETCRKWANEFGRAYQSNKLWMCIVPSHMLTGACLGVAETRGDIAVVGHLFPFDNPDAFHTFYHELGHNLGGEHEYQCYNDGDDSPVKPFNTIMTYDDSCESWPTDTVHYFTDDDKQFCQTPTLKEDTDPESYTPTEECFNLGTGKKSNRARMNSHRINRLLWFSVLMPLYWVSCFVVCILFFYYIYRRWFVEKKDEFHIENEQSTEKEPSIEEKAGMEPQIEGLAGGAIIEGHTSDLQMSKMDVV